MLSKDFITSGNIIQLPENIYFIMFTGHLMEAIDVLKDNLVVCDFMLQRIIVNKNILENDLYDYLYSVEEVNKLVMQGMSFREAYKKLGKEILEGDFKPSKEVVHTHEGSIGNLCLEAIRDKFEKSYTTLP